jgi:hypothetical protein
VSQAARLSKAANFLAAHESAFRSAGGTIEQSMRASATQLMREVEAHPAWADKAHIHHEGLMMMWEASLASADERDQVLVARLDGQLVAALALRPHKSFWVVASIGSTGMLRGAGPSLEMEAVRRAAAAGVGIKAEWTDKSRSYHLALGRTLEGRLAFWTASAVSQLATAKQVKLGGLPLRPMPTII